MACVDDSESFVEGLEVVAVGSPEEKKPIPRRNLSEAFEALCVDTATNSPEEAGMRKGKQQSLFSPTSVAQQFEQSETFTVLEEKDEEKTYEFNLHRDLSRDLSPHLISRVSLYAVIHDINKEAAAMAANDPQNKDDSKDELSPLVQAVTGTETVQQGPEVKCAMIDEETWLLNAISKRARNHGDEAVQACPPTFLQAIGEKEYENPVHALSGASRTQLWKPSRSWWEAKSGKNPWIEPNSHNKRWRYLWPFIHYHKFLAKCIKKLKRNGADVKHSVSPVAVFLREEVCAVSDHLAAVSLFDSEEWMACLHHFQGWTAEGSEIVLLAHVRRLKLRPINEPGDVDSPLLRSQIDEHFLKAMAAQREQLREIPTTVEAPKKTKGQLPVHPRPSSNAAAATAVAASPALSIPPNSGVRRPRYPLHQPLYWAGSAGTYEPQMLYGDNSSVQSGISTESGFTLHYQEYPTHHYHQHPMFPQHPQYAAYYSAPAMYAGGQYQMDPNQEVYHSMGNQVHAGWVEPAYVPYGVQPYYPEAKIVAPLSPQEQHAVSEKEEKEDHNSDGTPHLKNSPLTSPQHHGGYSPFWSHLVDGVAHSLVTPAKSPSTPNRVGGTCAPSFAVEEVDRSSVVAQPLLLRGYPYGYGHYGAHDGYAPPSPATQFMMPPTAQNNTFYYGGSLATSPSPVRANLTRKNTYLPTPVRKVVEIVSPSPSTVDTSAESESLVPATTA